MSPKRRRSVALAAAMLLLGGLSLLVGSRSRQVAPPSPIPAVDNPGPLGLEAAYRYLAQTGSARILSEPFTHLDASTQVVISALPYAQPVEESEQQAVLAWVERGGTLVVLGNHERGLGGALQGVLDPPSSALHLGDRELGLADLGRDVKALLDAATRPDAVEQLRGVPLVDDPLLSGVEALTVGAGRGFEIQAGAAVPLVGAGETALMLTLNHGSGRIVALAGPDALTNARIDRGSNLQLLANLGALGTVAFDEAHHVPAPAAGLGALGRAFGAALVALLACAAVNLATGLRRFGPPRMPAPAPLPSTADGARRLGRLYRRAGAAPHLAAALGRELADALRAELGLSSATGQGELRAATSRLPAAQATEAQALLQRLAAPGELSPEAYLELAARTSALKHALRKGLLTAPAPPPILGVRAAARAHPDPHG